MKNLSRIVLFVLSVVLLGSCQDEAENTPELISNAHVLEKHIDFKALEATFGKPDFDNAIEEKNEEFNLTVYTIPFFTPEYKRSVLVASLIDGEYDPQKTFIANIESNDKNYKSTDASFKGSYDTYRLGSNKPFFSREIDSDGEPNLTKDDVGLVGGGCIRIKAYEGGPAVCTLDQVGNCTGYKLSCMGFFESAACFATFPVCMSALAADCTTELCIDSNPTNDYYY
jgi:hypothetical protein